MFSTRAFATLFDAMTTALDQAEQFEGTDRVHAFHAASELWDSCYYMVHPPVLEFGPGLKEGLTMEMHDAYIADLDSYLETFDAIEAEM